MSARVKVLIVEVLMVEVGRMFCFFTAPFLSSVSTNRCLLLPRHCSLLRDRIMIITDNKDTVIFDANVCKLKTSAKYTETVNQCNLILFIGPLKGS